MKRMKNLMALLILISLSSMVFSCRPYQEKKYEEVAHNETAFVIPLEEMTKEGQTTLKSIDYLRDRKVAAKRIYNPTKWHSIGRMRWSGKWITTLKIIKVDRSPVTREWTEDDDSGTGQKREEIEVESKESIAFRIKITCTSSIPEEEAPEYLYFYKGQDLELVMDLNVRSFIQDILTSEFGKRDLATCQEQRSEIFQIMKDSTTAFFSRRGLKIDNIGAAGGFGYIDETIQTSINEKFQSKMKIESAENEVVAAQKFAKAANLIRQQKELDADIEIMKAKAQMQLKWNGVLGDGWTVIEGGDGNSIPGSIILGGKK